MTLIGVPYIINPALLEHTAPFEHPQIWFAKGTSYLFYLEFCYAKGISIFATPLFWVLYFPSICVTSTLGVIFLHLLPSNLLGFCLWFSQHQLPHLAPRVWVSFAPYWALPLIDSASMITRLVLTPLESSLLFGWLKRFVSDTLANIGELSFHLRSIIFDIFHPSSSHNFSSLFIIR